MRIRRPRLSHVCGAVLLATISLALGAVPGRAHASAAVRIRAGGSPATAVPEPGEMTTIDVGGLPTSIAVDQQTGTVWVVNSLDNTVSEISEARRAVVATIKVGASPVDIAADPRTRTIWVTCLGPFGRPAADNTVVEISEASRRVVARIKVGRAPFGIAADPRTGTVWVANTNSYTVSEISEARRAVVATIHTGAGASGAPDGVAVDPSHGVVWVATLGVAVDEIRAATRSVIATIKVKPGATADSLNAVTVDPNTGTPWVASDFYNGSNYVSYASRVGPASRRVIASVPVPRSGLFVNTADGIAADPATGTVWVAENGANMVTLVSEGRDAVARNLATGEEPVAVAVDSRTETVWVVNNYDDTVTEYSYSRPTFGTGAQISFRAGRKARFQVHTRGFPIAVMRVDGALPRGLRVRVGQGTVVLAGTPARSARGRTYRITISADNGVGTASGQYVVTRDLVVRVTSPRGRGAHSYRRSASASRAAN
jgi:YVTN family beta-propeller protein